MAQQAEDRDSETGGLPLSSDGRLVVDYEARRLAQQAISGLQALQSVLAERERGDERRWDAQAAMLRDIQSTYREGFVSLRDAGARGIEDVKASLGAALKTHCDEDNEVHTKFDDWRWKIVWAAFAFLGSSTLALIGVIWNLLPHKP